MHDHKKKWKKTGFCILLLCFMALSLSGFAIIYGDVNNDTQVTIIDALLTAQYTASINKPTGFSVAAADVNGDGTVSIIDALLIARYSAKLITYFPVEMITISPTPTPTCTSCTFVVSGTVKNTEGKILTGALIFRANDSQPSTQTDAQGNYALNFTGMTGAGCQFGADSFIRAAAGAHYTAESPWFSLNVCGDHVINFALRPIVTPTPPPTITPTPTPTPTCEQCTRYMSGTVTNTNGQPLAGAEVYEMSKLITTTDAQGNFSYSCSATRPKTYLCPTGDTYLIVKAAGYKEMSRFVTVDCGTYAYDYALTPVAE